MASRVVELLEVAGIEEGRAPIAGDCTACDACKPVCSNEAISVGSPVYLIDALRCTECVGAEDEPQCKLVCPADCIVPNPDIQEPDWQPSSAHRR